MSINTLFDNPIILAELGMHVKEIAGNVKLLGIQSGQGPAFTLVGGNTPTAILSQNVTLQNPGDQVVVVLSLTCNSTVAANTMFVLATMGLMVPPASLYRLISTNIETCFMVLTLTSSASQPATRTIQIGASALNAGSDIESSATNSSCYSLMVFEVLT